MVIILATRNPSKAEQIKGVFGDSIFTIQTLADTDITGEAVEDGETLTANAFKKALYVYERLNPKQWVAADDTGFFIRALDGAPGIKAARWAGENMETEEITAYTLERLAGITDRQATFRTVVALISPSGEKYFFNGTVTGKILEAPRRPPQPKMPYSAIFVPDGSELSWAEMTVQEENEISHRGKAFRRAKKFLERGLNL